MNLFKVVPLGGWNPYVVSAQRFTLITASGKHYPCISSSVPPHLLRGTSGQGNVTVDSILFDAGFESKEEAEGFGVRPGDTLVPSVETVKTANGKNIIAKSWDNRYGCTVMLEALEALKDEKLGHTLIAGANVQEEVGLRGSKVSTTKFAPDLFFAVDCSAADDLTTTTGTFGHLGEGTLMRIYDPGLIMLPRLREYLLDTAETNNIPYQYFVSKGGTDAGSAHTSVEGIPSTVIGVCGRYIHHRLNTTRFHHETCSLQWTVRRNYHHWNIWSPRRRYLCFATLIRYRKRWYRRILLWKASQVLSLVFVAVISILTKLCLTLRTSMQPGKC